MVWTILLSYKGGNVGLHRGEEGGMGGYEWSESIQCRGSMTQVWKGKCAEDEYEKNIEMEHGQHQINAGQKCQFVKEKTIIKLNYSRFT